MPPPKSKWEKYPDKYFLNPTNHPRDRIVIHESMEIPKEGLFFSLNGYPFLAKPGEPIDIPRPVRLMLDTRIKTETVQGEDGRDHTRNIPRITYTLVQENVGDLGGEGFGTTKTEPAINKADMSAAE